MSDYKDLTLAGHCGGAVEEKFRVSLEKVVKNIHDPNVIPDSIREITIKFQFKPDKNDSSQSSCTYHVTEKLSPLKPQNTIVFTGKDANGRWVAKSDSSVQVNLFDELDKIQVRKEPLQKEELKIIKKIGVELVDGIKDYKKEASNDR